jgi:hypothetical protein
MIAVRNAIRVGELMLLYGAFRLLSDVASPISLVLAVVYVYISLSFIVAIEWTLFPVLSLMH